MLNDVRWKQRFQNFEKAYDVLQRRADEYEKNQGVEVYQMALIQAYEILMELSWKTLKDYLENEEIKVNSPKQVIRQAFQLEMLVDGDAWMKALELRNLTTHTYDEEVMERVIEFISRRFRFVVRDLYFALKKEL